jgi:hypothetical protein
VLSIQNAAWVIGGTGTESAGTKWSCVRDNVTGLTWEVKTDSGSADSNTTDSTHTNIHTFVKVPATALASRPCEQSCADITAPVQVVLLPV